MCNASNLISVKSNTRFFGSPLSNKGIAQFLVRWLYTCGFILLECRELAYSG
jgi:preprotein translocase subunit SecG